MTEKKQPAKPKSEVNLADVEANTANGEPSTARPSWASRWFVRSGRKYRTLELIGIYATIIGAVAGLIALYITMYPSKPEPPIRPAFTVLVPLASTSSEYNAFMQKTDGTYEEKYNNQASQNIREIVKAAKTQWYKDHQSNNLRETEIDFFCFPEGFDDDATSFKKAFEHAVQIVERKGRQIVGLLGNVSSTSTLTYGEFCGAKKIPMILPLATATSLMKNLDLRLVPAVLRLPPPNDKQAENISTFLLDSGVFKTVILKDLTNETYSTDLIENFRESYVQEQLTKDAPNFGEIVATVPIGGKETSPFLYSALSGGETGLVIAGMTNSAIETLAQAKASGSNFRSIVLTDGAVDEYLGKRVKRIQNEKILDNLHLSFPSPCPLDNALAGYIANAPDLQDHIEDFQFTHALFVADGAYIIIDVLNAGTVNAATEPGSKILVDFIQNLKQKAEEEENAWIKRNPGIPTVSAPKGVGISIKLPFAEKSSRDYKIDKFGNNTNADYFIYKLNANSKWHAIEANKFEKSCFNKP